MDKATKTYKSSEKNQQSQDKKYLTSEKRDMCNLLSIVLILPKKT